MIILEDADGLKTILGERVTPVPLFKLEPDDVLVVDEDTEPNVVIDEKNILKVHTRNRSPQELSKVITICFSFAKMYPNKRLLFTPIGCGTPTARGTYMPVDIAALIFSKKYTIPLNVWLPIEFWNERRLTYPSDIVQRMQLVFDKNKETSVSGLLEDAAIVFQKQNTGAVSCAPSYGITDIAEVRQYSNPVTGDEEINVLMVDNQVINCRFNPLDAGENECIPFIPLLHLKENVVLPRSIIERVLDTPPFAVPAIICPTTTALSMSIEAIDRICDLSKY